MNIKGVFFDLYGTLLVYGDMKAAWADWLTVLYEGLATQGLSISKDSFAVHCDTFFAKDSPVLADDGLTVYERQINALCHKVEVTADSQILKDLADHSVAAWQEYIWIDPEAMKVLEELRCQKQLALISNFDHPPHLRALLLKHGLDDIFKIVVVSGEVNVKKPDPAIFSIALNAAKLDPSEVVYLGDSDEDVQGAHSAGIRPILIRRKRQDEDNLLLDFEVDPKNTKEHLYANSSDGVRTITKLQELLDIV